MDGAAIRKRCEELVATLPDAYVGFPSCVKRHAVIDLFETSLRGRAAGRDGEGAQLQARLTASEAAKKWTTARPTVAGWYWFRWNKSSIPQVVEAEAVQGHNDFWVRHLGFWIKSIKGGEFQGPLTPGEE